MLYQNNIDATKWYKHVSINACAIENAKFVETNKQHWVLKLNIDRENFCSTKTSKLSIMNFKRLLIVMLAFCFATFANAQDKIVTGKVTDSKNGSPLPGATKVQK